MRKNGIRNMIMLVVLTSLMIFVPIASKSEAVITREIVMGISAKYDGKVLENGKADFVEPFAHYTARPGSKIEIEANPDKMDSSLIIYVNWNGEVKKVATGSKTASFTVPNVEPGQSILVQVQGTIDNDAENYVGRSNNVVFYLDMPTDETTIDVNAYDGNTKLANESTTTKEVGSKLTLKATSNKAVEAIMYKWEDGNATQVNADSVTVTVPNYEAGSTHKLYVQAGAEDGKKSSLKTYNITIPEPVEETEIDVNLYDGNTKLKVGSTTVKEAGSKLTIKAITNKAVEAIMYQWDNEASKKVEKDSVSVTVPNYEAGTTHVLMIQAGADDGKKSEVKKYNIKMPEAEVETEVDVNLYDGNTKLVKGSTTTKEAGDVLTIKATTNRTIEAIMYQWDNEASKKVEKATVSVTVPNFEAGTIHVLMVQAGADDGKKSELKKYNIKMPEAIVIETEIDVNVYDGNTKLAKGSTTTKDAGSKLTIKATTNKELEAIMYQWDNEVAQKTSSSNVVVTVPNGNPGSTHTLLVQSGATDGKKSEAKKYYVKLPDALEGEITATVPEGKVSEDKNNPTTTEVGTEIKVKVNPEDNFMKVEYNWDDSTFQPLPDNRIIKVPNFKPGTTHKLTIRGTLKDGGVVTRVYYIHIPEEEDFELDIDPWMEENEDAEGLLVSLRNRSDIKKANQNFYMLGEEVIYLVDYKNAGKDITNEVKVELKLPLAFEVVDADGGEVNKDKKTITWTYANGLKKDAANTKTVIVKYTALSKKSYDSEIIYPQAIIYKQAKKQDVSAVINCIYRDEDTKLDVIHKPYMFGDKEKPTFRPDDGISRAEGALVLMRIFGVNYEGVSKITTKFSDIDETYREAQKAITKATELGVINGYPDGTYRPNEKMTRAEFMKIIAAYIEASAEVDGLEIKEEDAIVLYRNTKSKTSWATPYVTLLARLNMTSVSEREKDLRLEKEITRAEVAQLCNFYLFRAPAKITSSTRIDFTDVARTHKLFADIIEATRDEHEFTVTEDGREKVK